MFERIKNTVQGFFNSLSFTKKLILVVGVIAGILLFTFLIMFLTKVEYVPIANGLDAETARAITSELEQMGIPWQEEAGLSVIKVPKQDVSRARMELAVRVQSGNISWADVFGADSFTMTSMTREQMYIQAQTRDITEAIETLEPVEAAKVVLHIPKDTAYFVNRNAESKASITLKLRPGVQLDKKNISGIVNLVSSAVKGLTPENITIVDASTGNKLNDFEVGTASFHASTQLELKSAFENEVEKDLVAFLSSIYGGENVSVKANVELDFDKESETRRYYAPPIDGENSGLVRSATRIKENVNHEAGVGVPGTDTNTTAVTEGNDTGVYEKASETLNYELNESVRMLEKAEVKIKGLSVAVLINSKVLPDSVLTPEHKSELEQLVSIAVGTPREKITVASQEFADLLAMYDVFTDDAAEAKSQAQVFLFVSVAAILIVIVIVVILVMMAKKKKKQREEEEERRKLAELEKIESDTEEILGEIGEKEDKGSPKYHIERFIDKNPEAAVVLLRAWINE